MDRYILTINEAIEQANNINGHFQIKLLNEIQKQYNNGCTLVRITNLNEVLFCEFFDGDLKLIDIAFI